MGISKTEKLGIALGCLPGSNLVAGIIKFFIYLKREFDLKRQIQNCPSLKHGAAKANEVVKKAPFRAHDVANLKWFALLQVLPIVGIYGAYKEAALLKRINTAAKSAGVTPNTPTPKTPTQPKMLAQEQKDAEMIIGFITKEIQDTEQSFIQNLEKLNNWSLKLKDEPHAHEFGKELNAKVEPILNNAMAFEQGLDIAMKKPGAFDRAEAIAEVYEMHGLAYFNALKEYILQLSKYNAEMTRLADKYQEIMKQIQSSVTGGKEIDFESLSITPVQRGPRHALLLSSLTGKMKEMNRSSEAGKVKAQLEAVRAFITDINESSRAKEVKEIIAPMLSKGHLSRELIKEIQKYILKTVREYDYKNKVNQTNEAEKKKTDTQQKEIKENQTIGTQLSINDAKKLFEKTRDAQRKIHEVLYPLLKSEPDPSIRANLRKGIAKTGIALAKNGDLASACTLIAIAEQTENGLDPKNELKILEKYQSSLNEIKAAMEDLTRAEGVRSSEPEKRIAPANIPLNRSKEKIKTIKKLPANIMSALNKTIHYFREDHKEDIPNLFG